MLKQTLQWSPTKYLSSAANIELPERARQYFITLDSYVQNQPKPNYNLVPKLLLHAYTKLSKQQKIQYIRQNIRYICSILMHKQQNAYKLSKQAKTIVVKCQKKKMFCFYRTYLTIKLETQSSILIVNDDDTIKMIKLQNYIVHTQQAMFNNYIYLQPIVQSGNSWNTVPIFQFMLQAKQFNKIYDQLYACVMDIRNQQLIQLLTYDKQHMDLIRPGQLPQKLINIKQYLDFSAYKKQMLSQKCISYLNFDKKIYQQQNKQTKLIISSRSNDAKIFKAQYFAKNKDAYTLKQLFLQQLSQNKNQLLIQSQMLQNYQQSILTCIALYQKYFINNTAHSTIYMRQIFSLTDLLMANSLQSIISIQDKKRYDDFIFIKAINNPFVDNFFNYLFVFANDIHDHNRNNHNNFTSNHKIDNSNNNKYTAEIIIIGEFNFSNKFNISMVKQFLKQFYYCIFDIERSHKIDLQKKQSYKTVNFKKQNKMTQAINKDQNYKYSILKIDKQANDKEVVVQFAQPQLTTRMSRNKFITQQQIKVQKLSANYLKHKFMLKPIENYNIKNDVVKNSFMHGQWVRGQDGGLICTNQKLLQEHKKIYKHIIASIGSNIFKGGNILNFSLPVTIFKKEGHLQMIADSFSLAPRLLEGVKDPLERIKKSLIVSVGVGTLGISVQKPFFPTLGETLQVWIGGCPMYMEQIVRYPPTSAYLFYGRGYRIQGQVQPKISFSINGVKGYSQRPSSISFDDEQVIQISYGSMVISGIAMGDRQINFSDKAFAYDRKNNMFGQLIFGARQKQIFGKNKQKKDFLYGKIYEIDTQFAKKWSQTPPPKPYPSKKHIKKILSQFEGYWNGVIKFDDNQYIDFLKDLPFNVSNQQFALPSDTRFRKDLSNLIQGNIQQAQKQKQILQQGQRRNRKLRAQYQKKRK